MILDNETRKPKVFYYILNKAAGYNFHNRSPFDQLKKIPYIYEAIVISTSTHIIMNSIPPAKRNKLEHIQPNHPTTTNRLAC